MHLVLPVDNVGEPGGDEAFQVGGVGVGDLVGVQRVVIRSFPSRYCVSRVLDHQRPTVSQLAMAAVEAVLMEQI